MYVDSEFINREALLSVAQTFFENVELGDESLKVSTQTSHIIIICTHSHFFTQPHTHAHT